MNSYANEPFSRMLLLVTYGSGQNIKSLQSQYESCVCNFEAGGFSFFDSWQTPFLNVFLGISGKVKHKLMFSYTKVSHQ